MPSGRITSAQSRLIDMPQKLDELKVVILSFIAIPSVFPQVIPFIIVHRGIHHSLVYVIFMWYCMIKMQEIKWVSNTKTLHGVFFYFQSLFVGFSSGVTPATQSLKENCGNCHGMASSQDAFMCSLTRLERTKTPMK